MFTYVDTNLLDMFAHAGRIMFRNISSTHIQHKKNRQ